MAKKKAQETTRKKPKAAAKGIKAHNAADPGASVPDRVLDAALELAADLRWDDVGLGDIARRAGVDMATMREHFADKDDILIAYGRRVDRIVLGRFPTDTFDDETPHRDRLFDVLMERFDVLNDNRDAVLSFLLSFRTDPKNALCGLPHLGRSMEWMAACAGLELSGLMGAVKITGVTGVYLYTARAWMHDDSVDMAKTMAALDRGLGHLDNMAARVFGR